MLTLNTSHLRPVNSWYLRFTCRVLEAFLEPLYIIKLVFLKALKKETNIIY